MSWLNTDSEISPILSLTFAVMAKKCKIWHLRLPGNRWYMFKFIRSSRSEIEIWQIYDICSEKTFENVVWSPNYCSHLGTLGRWMNITAMSEFWKWLESPSFCACAVQIWLIATQMSTDCRFREKLVKSPITRLRVLFDCVEMWYAGALYAS